MLAASGWSAAIALQAMVDSTKKSVIADRVRALGKDRLDLAYKLARLRRDVPIECMRLLERKEPVAVPELAADLLPPDDDEVEASPVDVREPVRAPSAAIAVVDPSARMLTAPAEVRQRLLELQALVKSVMVANTDYGQIPGCGPKPVLFKSGAEKLGEVYGYMPEFEILKADEIWEEPPLFHYRIKCTLRRKADGGKIAEYVGSANSRESKWGARWVWEREVPDHIDRERLRSREITIKKGPRQGEKAMLFQVPNEQIFDQVNTILKMAEKRAFVGAILVACRASGVFAVDLEDMRPDPDAYGSVSDRPQWDQ
jgi:hypothetical protein